MTKRSTITCFVAIFIVTVNVIHGKESDEEYVDSVINSLLNGDSIEFTKDDTDQDSIGVEGLASCLGRKVYLVACQSDDEQVEQPIYEDGIWKCGSCDVIDESSLIYTEVYYIDTNDLDNVPYEVQVGLSVEGMQCVTVTSDAPSRLVTRVVHGSCTSHVTLAVHSAHEFTVRVYGKSQGFLK